VTNEVQDLLLSGSCQLAQGHPPPRPKVTGSALMYSAASRSLMRTQHDAIGLLQGERQ
jgi:hypothetical protein